MKIAVFGGSFNPVHNGHVNLAETVHKMLGYDRIVFVPAFRSPFKDMPEGASNEDRIAMLKLALEGREWAIVETCEIERKDVSYTSDTVEFLTEKYKREGTLDGKLGLLIGADLAEGFSRWHSVEKLVEMTDIILARRNKDEKPSFDYDCIYVDNELYAGASSEIRAAVKNDIYLQSVLPDKVYEYILQRGLYGI